MPDMDATDKRILRTMQEDPGLSITDIAKRVNLSHTPCWRRVKRLQAEGIIEGKALLLNRRALGFSVDVFAHMRIKHHEADTLEAFESEIQKHPEIVQCFSMSGESDYVLRVVIGSIEDYERFLKSTLLTLPGVESINSSFALKAVKLTTKLPI
ncbi:MAG: Lrp/AsnC family transcriptional regulator [Hyphomonadaceae bacterium]|nr:Lrp/AsnC family transcriptional regulator [Hyphomonadaceae bacterium]